MRYLTLAVIALTAGMVTSSLAASNKKKIAPDHVIDSYAQAPVIHPTYDDCFRLGWVRGVHVERDEWDEFYDQCVAGQVPFNSGMSVDSVEPEPQRH